MRIQQLEAEFAARLRADRMRPVQGMEERMALYRQEIEEQAKADVERQVCFSVLFAADLQPGTNLFILMCAHGCHSN